MSQEGPPADELVAAVQSRGPSAEELADAEDWANIRMVPEVLKNILAMYILIFTL